MKWPITSELVSTQSRGVSGSARQGELPLKSSFAEPGAGGLSADQQYAIRDLERAVERVKLLLKESSRNQNAPDKGITTNDAARNTKRYTSMVRVLVVV